MYSIPSNDGLCDHPGLMYNQYNKYYQPAEARISFGATKTYNNAGSEYNKKVDKI